MSSQLTQARDAFYAELIREKTLSIDDAGVATNADSSQETSRKIALHIANALGVEAQSKRLPGQQAGRRFEAAVRNYLETTMSLFPMLRPGAWKVENVGGKRAEYHVAQYEPYTHLDELAKAIERDVTLGAALGNAYDISPDVLVLREPETDAFINRDAALVDLESGRRAIIRKANNERAIVHAVISCKWTLRSDRAQNARSEALNVIRNRKGRTPHIAVVTGEPTPSRLASLALGTGDLDTVYRFALPELIEAVAATGNDEAQTMLTMLLSGKRLRDISDLPLDLAV